MDYDGIADISLISSIISCVFVLIVLILGCLIRSWSPDDKCPKRWARPWILISILCCYVINSILLYFSTDITCITIRISVSISVTSRLSVVLLGINVLISFYTPRILLSKRQLAIWTFLILIVWVVGPVLSFTFTNSVTVNNGTFIGTETSTSGFRTSKQTTSLLDALDMEFETELLQSSELTSVRYTTSQDVLGNYQYDEENDSYCTVNDKFIGIFMQITECILIVCGMFVLIAFILDFVSLPRKISSIPQGCQTSIPSSQRLNLKWIEQQRISLALFIELHAVHDCSYLVCEYGNMEYWSIVYQYFKMLYPLVFSLSCFMLKEVRTTIFHIYTLLHTNRRQNEDVNRPQPEFLDT